MPGFWEQYNQFFPEMSSYNFGDEFSANLTGGSATLSGNNLPEVNRIIATTNGPTFSELIPKIPGINNPFAIGVGTDTATLEMRRQPNRFNDLLNNIGVGMLGLVLIAAGVVYLGFVAYRSNAVGKAVEAVT